MSVAQSTHKLRKRTCIVGLIVGLLMLLMGTVAIPLGFQALMDYILDTMMVLSPKSPIFAEWEDPTLPIYTKFYFFDVQNPEEVLKGAKPIVVEMGPYAYRMSLPRVNVSFNSNGTVTSTQPYSYVFDRSQSVGDQNDTFMTANMPFWSTVYFVRDRSPIIQAGLALFLSQVNEQPFIRLTVEQLVWGYDEPLFTWVHKYLPEFPLPAGFETQFGFLLGRNNTALGVYNVFTGVDNKTMVNQIDKFDGRSDLSYWNTNETNMINGTDGMMYHRNIEESEVLYLFHPDLCRSVPYSYVKEDSLQGVPLKMFGLAPWAYENGSTYPPNEGFKITPDDVPRGLMRIDPCKFGTPTALSNPHFFDSDPSLAAAVIGLNPGGDEHRNYFSIEPILGMPFKLRMRLQINQYMQQVSGIWQTENVNTMYMPGFWFEEDVTGNEEVIGYYNTGIKLTGIISQVIQYLFTVLGASIIVAFLFVGICRLVTEPKKSIIEESDESTYGTAHAYDNNSAMPSLEKNIQSC